MRTASTSLALLLAVLTACGTGAPEHVRIGVIAPLTGDRSYLGEEVVAGAELAVADLERSGGLLGDDVELVVIDDADLIDLPRQLADLAERHRVSAVVGPEAPGPLLGPRSPLQRRDVPALLPTAFAGDLEEAPTFVARTVPGAAAQAAALARWLTETRGTDRVGLLVADPVEGGAVESALERGLADGGAEVAATVRVAGAAVRLEPAVARLRDAAPDVGAVLLWAPPPAAARATLAVRGLGWDVQIAVPASAIVAEYRSLAGDASEGVVLPFPFRPEWFGVEMTELMVRYHTAHGLAALPGLDTLVLDIPVVAIAAYDAVHAVAAAVEAAGTREPAAVSDAFEDGLVHDGMLRDYRFGPGEVWQPGDLHIARFHRFATVFDVDPRLDRDEQRTFWQRQVAADYLPGEVLQGPAGAILRQLLEGRREDVPEYRPPDPPPGPVARP